MKHLKPRPLANLECANWCWGIRFGGYGRSSQKHCSSHPSILILHSRYRGIVALQGNHPQKCCHSALADLLYLSLFVIVCLLFDCFGDLLCWIWTILPAIFGSGGNWEWWFGRRLKKIIFFQGPFPNWTTPCLLAQGWKPNQFFESPGFPHFSTANNGCSWRKPTDRPEFPISSVNQHRKLISMFSIFHTFCKLYSELV